MARPRIDVTGQRFGRLTVQSTVGRCDWICACDCGGTRMAPTAHLRSGRVHSCGCDAAGPKEELSGRKYGKWTVLQHAGGSRWACLCDCGTKKTVFAPTLKNGQSTSCGCNRLIPKPDLTGKRYGKLTVLTYVGRAQWRYRCDCGAEKLGEGGHLKDGRIRSCGAPGCRAKRPQKVPESKVRKVRTYHARQELSGQKFGRWTAMAYAGGGKWTCLCDCGKTKEVMTTSLRIGSSTSCGCRNSEVTRTRNLTSNPTRRTPVQDLAGVRFGRLIAEDYVKKSMWRCLCDCGNRTFVRACHLKNGDVVSCGCFFLETARGLLPRRRRDNDRLRRQRATVRARQSWRYNTDPAYRERRREERRKLDKTPRGKAQRAAANARRYGMLRENCDFGGDEWERMKTAWGHRCAYCRCQPDNLTRDHLTAVVLGGFHTAKNIVPACQRCNSKKRDLPLGEALRRLDVDADEFWQRVERAYSALTQTEQAA